MKEYKPFKYSTEAGINLYLGHHQLCQQSDFKYLIDDPLIPYYSIYFICQRNRIEMKPGSEVITKDSITIYCNVYDKDTIFSVPVVFNNHFKSKKVKLECEFPYNYIILENSSKEKILIKVSHILDELRNNIIPKPTFLDLEVVYIGQTNRDSEKPIVDRLVNHQTLQEIYSKKTPDKDIYLLLCCFEADTRIESRGTVRTQKKYEKEDEKRLLKYLQNKAEISREQQINLAEAALIKYFDPENNKTYTKTFPKPTHTKYDECYKLDLNAVSIEINITNYLYSKTVSSSKNHFKSFRLTTDAERRDLFDYSVGFDT